MLIPTKTVSVEIEIKKSRFIAIAVPLESPEQAKSLISQSRKQHPEASHVVHAYVLGKRGDLFGLSDDREPRNTAGRPVLGVLKGSGITNILVMVVRYFGGTKLGTGGLVHAYSGAAKEVLSCVLVEKLIQKTLFSVNIGYELYEQAKIILSTHHAEILNEVFETSITLTGKLPENEFLTASGKIIDLSSGRVILTPTP
jgi:uncharacterized YigZ family protein